MEQDKAASAPANAAAMSQMPRRAKRWRWAARSVLAVAIVFSTLCLLVLVACGSDDAAIDEHPGQAVADVLAVAVNRTAVRFPIPGGLESIPPNGVLYPSGLAAGERVRVEYDTADPDLVRVAGRNYQLALLPVGITIAVTWVVAGPTVWRLRRKSRAALNKTS